LQVGRFQEAFLYYMKIGHQHSPGLRKT